MTKARVNADNASADIQGVTASTGLTGGGTSGTVSLAVDTTVIQARVANVTDTEIGYLDGVTSSIQTQLNAAGGGSLASQDFTSSGTWTRPTGVTTAWVLLVGAGGAGGGAGAGSSIAGGGGGGGMVKFQLIDVSASPTVTVTLGTGGTGGTTHPAADGGDSTFGALLTAKGGKGARTTTGTVSDQNGGAYSSDTGSLGSGGGGGAGGVGGTALGLVYSSTYTAGYFEKYGIATGTGNSAGGTAKFYPGGGSVYIVGGTGGPGWWGYGGGGGGGIYPNSAGFVGTGSSGGGSGGSGTAGGNGQANTGGGGGGTMKMVQ
jgi:hypothetical protein